jgi:transcriptional regulator with XRE-family HTH domain
MIRISDPGRLGPALGNLRHRQGLTRRTVARRIAVATGRDEQSTYQQLAQWENGDKAPNVTSLPDLLHALGYDLALIPREDTV